MKVDFTQTLPTWVEPANPSPLDDASVKAIIRELNTIDREGNYRIGDTIQVRVSRQFSTDHETDDDGRILIHDRLIYFTKTGPHEYYRHE